MVNWLLRIQPNTQKEGRIYEKIFAGLKINFFNFSKTLEKEGFDALVRQIAESKKSSYEAVLEKLNSVSGPSTAGTTGVANAGNVARMTDTSKYTGAHKERFDADGKGKGIDGREERTKNTGYVGNYKNDGTYDQTHK